MYLLQGVLDDAEAVVERVEGAEHDDQLVEHVVQGDLAQHHASEHVPWCHKEHEDLELCGHCLEK